MPRSLALLAALALAATIPTVAAAEDLLPAQPLVRHFPQGLYCPLPVSLSFVAPATPVTITFTAVEFLDDGFGTVTWTEQAVDNVTLATTAEVSANTEDPPASSSQATCYDGGPTPATYFHFNRAGLTFARLDLFDVDPAASGWDLAAGGYYSNRAAPRDVENCVDATGGSLGLGDGTRAPVDGATAGASITVSDLVPGTSYDLGAWWFANFVRFPYGATYLTITVTTDAGTPVARRSWGTLKAAQR